MKMNNKEEVKAIIKNSELFELDLDQMNLTEIIRSNSGDERLELILKFLLAGLSKDECFVSYIEQTKDQDFSYILLKQKDECYLIISNDQTRTIYKLY